MKKLFTHLIIFIYVFTFVSVIKGMQLHKENRIKIDSADQDIARNGDASVSGGKIAELIEGNVEHEAKRKNQGHLLNFLSEDLEKLEQILRQIRREEIRRQKLNKYIRRNDKILAHLNFREKNNKLMDKLHINNAYSGRSDEPEVRSDKKTKSWREVNYNMSNTIETSPDSETDEDIDLGQDLKGDMIGRSQTQAKQTSNSNIVSYNNNHAGLKVAIESSDKEKYKELMTKQMIDDVGTYNKQKRIDKLQSSDDTKLLSQILLGTNNITDNDPSVKFIIEHTDVDKKISPADLNSNKTESNDVSFIDRVNTKSVNISDSKLKKMANENVDFNGQEFLNSQNMKESLEAQRRQKELFEESGIVYDNQNRENQRDIANKIQKSWRNDDEVDEKIFPNYESEDFEELDDEDDVKNLSPDKESDEDGESEIKFYEEPKPNKNSPQL